MENMEETKEIQSETTVLPASEPKVEQKRIKLNKKAIIIIAIVVVLGVVAYLAKGLVVAATVDGSPISRWSVLRTLEQESGQTAMDSLIAEKLVANEAKNKKIVISDEVINAEIKKIEEQVVGQGADTFEEILAQQGLTLEVFKTRITLQKKLEALLADKVAVSDEEVTKYISDNKTTIPEGQEAMIKDQVKAELVNQKLSENAPQYISDLKAKAKIKYFVNYK